jgi:hypothetical protein
MLRGLAKSHRPSADHHINRLARLGTQRSIMMPVGIIPRNSSSLRGRIEAADLHCRLRRRSVDLRLRLSRWRAGDGGLLALLAGCDGALLSARPVGIGRCQVAPRRTGNRHQGWQAAPAMSASDCATIVRETIGRFPVDTIVGFVYRPRLNSQKRPETPAHRGETEKGFLQ